MKKELIELRVNGRKHELAIEPSELLLDVLRQELDSRDRSAAVTIRPAARARCWWMASRCCRARMLAASCEGQEITTIEGVAEHGSLAAIRKPMATGAARSVATARPGFMMTVKALLAEILIRAKKRFATR